MYQVYTQESVGWKENQSQLLQSRVQKDTYSHQARDQEPEGYRTVTVLINLLETTAKSKKNIQRGGYRFFGRAPTLQTHAHVPSSKKVIFEISAVGAKNTQFLHSFSNTYNLVTFLSIRHSDGPAVKQIITTKNVF
jgi:hypothetical protein